MVQQGQGRCKRSDDDQAVHTTVNATTATATRFPNDTFGTTLLRSGPSGRRVRGHASPGRRLDGH